MYSITDYKEFLEAMPVSQWIPMLKWQTGLLLFQICLGLVFGYLLVIDFLSVCVTVSVFVLAAN